jgi:hypothetical protein
VALSCDSVWLCSDLFGQIRAEKVKRFLGY